jgi:hypothetical protein
MQLYELVQILPDIPLALRTPHSSRLLFVHQDATPRAEPLAADAKASVGEAEVFGFLSFAYEA